MYVCLLLNDGFNVSFRSHYFHVFIVCIFIYNPQLPTFPPELKPSEKRPTSSFKTSGRTSAFIENSTMFYKSLHDEVALTNLGPGSYNLAYSWRTDEHNYAHLR